MVDPILGGDTKGLSGRYIYIDNRLRPIRAKYLNFLKEDDHEQFQKNQKNIQK